MNIKSKSENIVTLLDRFTKKQDKMMLWKARHDELKDELRNEALKNELASEYIKILVENIAMLHEEFEQWNDTVNKTRQDYEETIHLLMPEIFEKKWVKNIDKKVSLYGGNNFLCSILVLLLTCLFILKHQVSTWNSILIQIN